LLLNGWILKNKEKHSSANTMTCHDNTGYAIFIQKNSLKFAHSVLWGIVSKDSSNKQIVVGYGSCEEF